MKNLHTAAKKPNHFHDLKPSKQCLVCGFFCVCVFMCEGFLKVFSIFVMQLMRSVNVCVSDGCLVTSLCPGHVCVCV